MDDRLAAFARKLAERWLFEPPPPPTGQERRGAVRFNLQREVTVRRAGMLSAGAATINVSRTGAALRVGTAGGAWLAKLQPGDEVTLCGLVKAPVDCWVVELDQAVLRLRFVSAPTADGLLSRLIAQLEAASPKPAAPKARVAARRLRRPVMAAGGAGLLLILVALGYLGRALVPPLAPQSWQPAPRTGLRPGELPPVRMAEGPGTGGAHGTAAADPADAKGSPPAKPPDAKDRADQPPPLALTSGTEFTAIMADRIGASGRATADVAADVLDTTTGEHVLLPRATRLTGMALRDGGKRKVLGVIWTEGVMPDGTLVRLDPGTAAPPAAVRAAAVPAAARDTVRTPAGDPVQDMGDAYLLTLRARGAAQVLSDLSAGNAVLVTVNRDLLLPSHDKPGFGRNP